MSVVSMPRGSDTWKTEVAQKLASLERRLDQCVQKLAPDAPQGLESRLAKLELQLPQLEVQVGEFLGATSGAKEAVAAQARQLSCVEERLSSQLEAVQANVQVYQTKFTALEEELEASMSTLRALAKYQALLSKLAASEEEEPQAETSSYNAQMQELVLDLASRISSLESFDRSGRPPPESTTCEESVRPQLQLLEASSQRLHREMLGVLAKLEEHSVHLSSYRNRMDVLEGHQLNDTTSKKPP